MLIDVKGLARFVVVLVVVAGFLGILIIKSHHVDFVRAQADKSAAQEKKPGPANDYLFSEATPSGSWLAQAEFDMSQTSQTNDRNTPVVTLARRSLGLGRALAYALM